MLSSEKSFVAFYMPTGSRAKWTKPQGMCQLDNATPLQGTDPHLLLPHLDILAVCGTLYAWESETCGQGEAEKCRSSW